MHRSLSAFVLIWLSACAPTASMAPEPTAGAAGAKSGAAPRIAALPTVAVNPDRALGDPQARLAIVEFGDYQCPYCRAFHAGTFRELRAAYIDTGKVRYFHKDFPLRSHAQAFAAAVIAFCAGAQGRFFEMQDQLYAKQARLGEALYNELVAALELDTTEFDACRRSRSAQYAVRRDLEEGRRIQITGTPSFVLGRIEGDRVVVERMAAGAPSFETFARELDALSR